MVVPVGMSSALVGLAFEGRLGIKKSSAVSPAKAGDFPNFEVVFEAVTESLVPL